MRETAEIRSDIEAIETNVEIRDEVNFVGRAEAIDFIGFHIIDGIESLLNNYSNEKECLQLLKQRAENIKRELELIDKLLFEKLRKGIRAGKYTGPAFSQMMNQYSGNSFNGIASSEAGYDNLDVFINKPLSLQEIPEETLIREPGMVFYQKTPARIVLEIVGLGKIGPNDVFFDLGSGLGQVAILVNLVSGAKCIGIEYEPAFCDYASRCAAELNLSEVEFINTDAREAGYSKGTVFFLYTPFEGEILLKVLAMLQRESLTKPIKVFTYGPCSSVVACQKWLNCINGNPDDPYQLCEFRSLDINH